MQVEMVAKNVEQVLKHASEHVHAIMGDYYSKPDNYMSLQEVALSLDKAAIQMRRVQYMLDRIGLDGCDATCSITKLVDLLPVELVEELLQDLLKELDADSLFWDALYEEYEAEYPERSESFLSKELL